MLEVSVYLFDIHSCSLPSGVPTLLLPTPCSFCMHLWTLMDKLSYIRVYTRPHSYFHICTCLGVYT